MKHWTTLLGLGGALLLGIACFAADSPDSAKAPEPKPDSDGFYELFDGKDLNGWKIGDNAKTFHVEDGKIIANGNGPAHLFYEGPVHNHDWKDFHLKAEVMTHPHANSGIYFHTKYQESGWPDQGFEAQVNATHTDWKKTGSIYNVVDLRDPHHKDNEWFLYEIIVKGNHVTLKINGKTVNDWTQPADWKGAPGMPGRFLQHGTIALQGHDPGSKAEYKSAKIKALD